MTKGKIKKMIEDKGYGFIIAEDGREIFFHKSSLQGLDFMDLKKGDPVEFDMDQDKGGRGLRAVSVKRTSV